MGYFTHHADTRLSLYTFYIIPEIDTFLKQNFCLKLNNYLFFVKKPTAFFC